MYDIIFGIAEVASDGSCVITKHDQKNGMVTEDTVKCQFLYELQGNVYLNSDVKALLDGVRVEREGRDRYVTLSFSSSLLIILVFGLKENDVCADFGMFIG